MASMGDVEVWYVSFGSNMCRERLACYLAGGQPEGAFVTYPGARDSTMPNDEATVELPGRLYFAGESPIWGGGVAFYDHDRPGPTPAIAYRLSAGQFADIAAQEMHRRPGPGTALEAAIAVGPTGLPGGRFRSGPGSYETVIDVGGRDGLPMLTITAGHTLDAVEHTLPVQAYLDMLAAGLRTGHGWDEARIDEYFAMVTSQTQPGPLTSGSDRAEQRLGIGRMQ